MNNRNTGSWAGCFVEKKCLNAAETSQDGEGIFAKETVKGVRVGQSKINHEDCLTLGAWVRGQWQGGGAGHGVMRKRNKSGRQIQARRMACDGKLGWGRPEGRGGAKGGQEGGKEEPRGGGEEAGWGGGARGGGEEVPEGGGDKT